MLVTLACLIIQSSAAPEISSAQHARPAITEARLDGEKLIVTGQNFGSESLILVNHRREITTHVDSEPAKVLVAPTAGRRVGRDEIIVVQVQDSQGGTSDEFPVFTGRVVTLEANGNVIMLRTGQKVLLQLNNEPYEWRTTVHDARIIRRAQSAAGIRGAQGIYEALRPGKTSLSAEGEMPCHRATPPCMTPTLAFAIRIVVE